MERQSEKKRLKETKEGNGSQRDTHR